MRLAKGPRKGELTVQDVKKWESEVRAIPSKTMTSKLSPTRISLDTSTLPLIQLQELESLRERLQTYLIQGLDLVPRGLPDKQETEI